MKRFTTGLAGAVLIATTFNANAQFPNRPIRLIVPFGAGGITDIVARHVSKTWSEKLGTDVIVENRPGAGGVIAAQLGANAAPDGYTVFMGTVGTQVVSPLIMKSLAYDPEKSFKPLGMVSAAPYVLAARSSLGIKTYADLVAYAKKNPGKLNFGSAGNASSPHLGLELLKLTEGVDIVHVPFKSGGEAVNAAIGEQVDLVMDAIPVVMPHAKSGKLNAILLANGAPLPNADGVPTTIDIGAPSMQISSWSAFYVPAETPDAAVQKLNASLRDALQDADLQARAVTQGITLLNADLKDYATFINVERTRWSEIVTRANIHLD